MKNDPFHFVQPNRQRSNQPRADFQELEATELYCPKCGRAVPVKKFLLLILPDGDKYEYRCQFCGTKVGDKTDRSGQFYDVLGG
jgi:rubredoxin